MIDLRLHSEIHLRDASSSNVWDSLSCSRLGRDWGCERKFEFHLNRLTLSLLSHMGIIFTTFNASWCNKNEIQLLGTRLDGFFYDDSPGFSMLMMWNSLSVQDSFRYMSEEDKRYEKEFFYYTKLNERWCVQFNSQVSSVYRSWRAVKHSSVLHVRARQDSPTTMHLSETQTPCYRINHKLFQI